MAKKKAPVSKQKSQKQIEDSILKATKKLSKDLPLGVAILNMIDVALSYDDMTDEEKFFTGRKIVEDFLETNAGHKDIKAAEVQLEVYFLAIFGPVIGEKSDDMNILAKDINTGSETSKPEEKKKRTRKPKKTE